MENNIKRRGLLLVLSSISGGGKSTLAKELLKRDSHLTHSVSYTTRKKRKDEVDGKDYFFINTKTFDNLVSEEFFLEYTKIYNESYGTSKSFVEKLINNGRDIVFDIDWYGLRAFKKILPDDVVSIFILPPSRNAQKERLLKRDKDLKSIQYRLEKADQDLSNWVEYDYSIINDKLEDSINKLIYILRAERLKKARRPGVVSFVNQLLQEK